MNASTHRGNSAKAAGGLPPVLAQALVALFLAAALLFAPGIYAGGNAAFADDTADVATAGVRDAAPIDDSSEIAQLPSSAQDYLAQLQAQIESTALDYDTAVARVAELSQQIADTQARLDEINALLPQQREASATSMRALYLMQQEGFGLLETILSSTSLADFLQTMDYIEHLQESNVAKLQQLDNLCAELAIAQAQLENDSRDAQDAADRAARAMEQAKNARQEAKQRAIAEAAEQMARQQELAAQLAAERELVMLGGATANAQTADASQGQSAPQTDGLALRSASLIDLVNARQEAGGEEGAQDQASQAASSAGSSDAASSHEPAADGGAAGADGGAGADEAAVSGHSSTPVDEQPAETEAETAPEPAEGVDAANDVAPVLQEEPEAEAQGVVEDGDVEITDRDAFIAEWTARIDAYLAGSPMEGQGVTFATAAWNYGVDPRWSPAISCAESSKGAICFLPYNAWGWGNISWGSWEEAIDAHVAGLARGYGYTITLEAAYKYCPPNANHWYNTVLSQMNTI